MMCGNVCVCGGVGLLDLCPLEHSQPQEESSEWEGLESRRGNLEGLVIDLVTGSKCYAGGQHDCLLGLV